MPQRERNRCTRVLVVEDDHYVRRALLRVLGRSGYTVVAVETGEAALEVLESGETDAVVLDWGLPGLDGPQVLERLRGSGNRVPVLFLSGESAPCDRATALNAGADDYAVKPCSQEELEAKIDSLVQRHRLALAEGE